MCQICMEPETEDLCRVNCDAGHIFHCSCITQYRNTYTDFGWNNKCPVCRIVISKMVKVPAGMSLPMEFGKRRKRSGGRIGASKTLPVTYGHFAPAMPLKQLKADIVYLKKK